MKKIFVSPAHFINNLVLIVMILLCIVALIICSIVYQLSKETFLVFSITIGIYIVALLPFCIISRKGMIYVVLGKDGVTSFLFGKKRIALKWDEITHIAFVKSNNYGMDIQPVYMVLSCEPIKGKNLALSYDQYKQIVIRISKNNFTFVKENIPNQTIAEKFGTSLTDLDSIVRICNMTLFKNEDGDWV